VTFSFTSTVAPMLRDDIDTDQIIPARYLTTTEKAGLGEKLFIDLRGEGFVLDDPRYRGAQVLLAGRNFGSGSSREHAPWALVDHGFRAVVARSFADIFAGNALKNGLLVIAVDEAPHRALIEAVERDPRAEVDIDLSAETLTLPDGQAVTFAIDPFIKHMLLEGLDELAFLVGLEEAIGRFEAAHEGA
jgi:3-isopropylmalate/(R)-2-methylmalate dehydratase small subunit